jgi:hypothetical protein
LRGFAFLGYADLWQGLGELFLDAGVPLKRGGSKLLLEDDRGRNWLLIEFLRRERLTVDFVEDTLYCAGFLPDCIYYHRYSDEGGGGDDSFAVELHKRTNAFVSCFTGMKPDAVLNRGYFLLSRLEIAAERGELHYDRSDNHVHIARLPMEADGVDISRAAISNLRRYIGRANGTPTDLDRDLRLLGVGIDRFVQSSVDLDELRQRAMAIESSMHSDTWGVAKVERELDALERLLLSAAWKLTSR